MQILHTKWYRWCNFWCPRQSDICADIRIDRKKKLIGGFEFIAIKIVLYEKVSQSKDPTHKYLKFIPRDNNDRYDRIIL